MIEALRSASIATGGLRVAVVHDYLTQRGGAERVVLAIMRAFPGATLHTSVYAPGNTFPEFADLDVRTSWLRRIPLARRDPRYALPLLPRVFESMRLPEADVVICSSSGWAHGVPTRVPKLVYCHNPPRWLHQTSEYAGSQPLPVRVGLEMLRNRLLRWDRSAVEATDRYVVNSTAVGERVSRLYGRESTVLAPPPGLSADGPQEPVPGIEPGYLLTVSRPRGYKNARVLAEAIAAMPDERLVAVGGIGAPDALAASPELAARVTELRGIPDSQLRWLYANCSALLAVSYEDFGLSPVEANSFGRPTACLRSGGYLDTMAPGISGVFVERLSPASIVEAVRHLHRLHFDPEHIRRHAAQFSIGAFTMQLHAEVDALLGRTGPGRRTVTLPAEQSSVVNLDGPAVPVQRPIQLPIQQRPNS